MRDCRPWGLRQVSVRHILADALAGNRLVRKVLAGRITLEALRSRQQRCLRLVSQLIPTRLDPIIPFVFDLFFFTKRAELIDSTASIKIFLTE
jgi:hypothetical protein